MDYLIEIGTEELPAGSIGKFVTSFKDIVNKNLQEKQISEFSLVSYATPRRIALQIFGLPEETKANEEVIKGPGLQAPFQVLEGFASKQGVAVEDLQNDGKRYFLNKTIAPVPISQVVQEIVPVSIKGLSADRWMSWGDGEHSFIRPVKWLVSLLDNKVLELDLFGLQSGSKTRINRLEESSTLFEKFVEIPSAKDYEQTLGKYSVQASQGKRKENILKQIKEIESENGFTVTKIQTTVQDDLGVCEELLDEVVDLIENPKVLVGQFEEKYLELPSFLTETVLIHHQRYFPCYKEGTLTNTFVFVASCVPEAENTVIEGNQKVLKARLRDAQFFVQEDLKQPLQNNLEKLKKVTFLKELGVEQCTYYDKVQRIKNAIIHYSRKEEEKKELEQAAELCKCDLVSSMVFEFPELQGQVGGFIAAKQNQTKNIAEGIKEHYLPLSMEGGTPNNIVGKYLSITDKADSIVSLFSVGKIPTGSADPYALRRQAQGIIKILLEELLPLSLKDHIFRVSYKALKGNEDDYEEFWKDKLEPFLKQRILFILAAKYDSELVDACSTQKTNIEGSVHHFPTRIKTLQEFDLANYQEFVEALICIRRISRVLKDFEEVCKFQESLLKEDSEKDLSQYFRGWKTTFINVSGTQQSWFVLRDLTKPINNFFENVLVNDPDVAIANNRKALLKEILNCIEKQFNYPDWDKLINYFEKKAA